MRKLNSKKKLIGAIAIILVAVILAIAITTNIVNRQIGNEGYLSTTANAGSNLIANYILNGITIGGITGKMDVLNTNDATARADDIAKGKIAYARGERIVGTREPSLSEISGNETENTKTKDKYGNKIVIPAGFKVVNPNDDVTKGIIIEDVCAGDENTKGSQFVWIPIGDIITDNNGNTVTITLGRYTFANNGKETLAQSAENWNQEIGIDNIKELSSTSYNKGTAKNLKDFTQKALSSGGYYLGRYEAGDALAINSPKSGTLDVSNPNNPITCKSTVYPYSYVNQKDATNLCQNMYNSNNFESDMCNSYTWDTAIVFIQNVSGDENYSMQGRLQTSIAKCGHATNGSIYDVRCNIYDIAGNTFEWSTETSSSSAEPCVSRGAGYTVANTVSRNRAINKTSYSDLCMGFRPILYL